MKHLVNELVRFLGVDAEDGLCTELLPKLVLFNLFPERDGQKGIQTVLTPTNQSNITNITSLHYRENIPWCAFPNRGFPGGNSNSCLRAIVA